MPYIRRSDAKVTWQACKYCVHQLVNADSFTYMIKTRDHFSFSSAIMPQNGENLEFV